MVGKLVILLSALLLLAVPVHAQENAVLSMQIATADLQTGQEYEVQVRLDGAVDVWLVSVEISYDPESVYILGTRSGSPMRRGDFFTSGSSVVVRNQVQSRKLVYIISMQGQVSPLNGGGIVGTFRVYPLAPGPTTLLFSQAEVIKITVTETDQGLVGSNPQPLPFTPVLLDLNVTGSPVSPPTEATATPAPTLTATPVDTTEPFRPTTQPTLVNVTAVPSTATAILETPAALSAENEDNSPLLVAAIVVMAVGAIGLAVMAFLWMRSRRN